MSRLWLYRTLAIDDEGDPYDFGAIRAANIKVAEKKVRERLRKFDWDDAPFKIYPLKDRLTSGVLSDWKGEEPVVFSKRN